MNPNFANLSFSDTDNSFNSNYAHPQYSRTCSFNCFCCARINLGMFCSCNTPKATVSTQTYDFDFPQGDQVSPDNMWKRGTFEHGVVQKLISITLEKFAPVSARDGLKMNASLEEIAFRIKTQYPSYQLDMKKLRQRVLKTLEWQRYYAKKRQQAKEENTSTWEVLGRKRKENKENQPLVDKADNSKELGTVNPAFTSNPESDSDSDVPLAMLAKRSCEK